jgi:GT2 family glycosyltransferase
VGTCLLVNLAATGDVGLLDQRFFMYYEDLDWSIRFRLAGYRLRLVAGARIYHRIGASSGGADSPKQRYLLARSSVLFFRRHARQGRPWQIAFFRLGAAAKAVAKFALRGRFDVAGAYLRGLLDGWRLAGLG